MKPRTEDAYSPNYALLTILLSVAITAIFAGRSLWIPAAKIENLHVRAVVLALTDGVASFAADTGFDAIMPAAREAFLAATDLDTQTEWDTRYFNRRTVDSAPSFQGAVPGSADNTARAPDVSLTEPSQVTEPIFANTDVVSPGAEQAGSSETARPDNSVVALSDSSVSAQADQVTQAGLASGEGVAARPPAINGIHSTANPLRVYFFGDSQVYSLGNGLSRVVGKDSPIVVDFLAVHSSGFIRGDYFNWPAKLADTLGSGSYDTVVMMLGMNDYQNFWDNDGKIMKKRTPEWEAAYAEKCSAIIDIALLSVPRVYWIGMPRVKDPVYEETLRYIDGVQDRIAAAYGPGIVVRCPITDALPGSDGNYLATLNLDAGKTLQVMSSDGSHFTVEGGQYAMKPLFDLLVADWLFSEIPVAHLPE